MGNLAKSFRPDRPTLLRWLIRASAAAITLLGLSVVLGWNFRANLLVRLVSGPGMAYDTALCFLLAGAALFAMEGRGHTVARLMGAAVLAVTGAQLIGYLAWGAPMFDLWGVQPWAKGPRPFSANISPNAAIALALFGLAVTLAGWPGLQRWRGWLLSIPGAAVFSLALIALGGYLFEKPAAYGWRNFSQIAVQTAAGLILAGISLIALSLRDERENAIPAWLPAAVAVCSVCCTLLAWQALIADHMQQLRGELAPEHMPVAGYSWANIILLLGFALGAMSAVATAAARAAQLRMRAAAQSNLLLAEEVRRRTDVERELRESQATLESRVNERTAALAESEARKSAILNTALDGIIVANEEGTILAFNPAAETIFGRRREDAEGRDITDVLVPPRLRERHRAGLQSVASGDRPAYPGRRMETVGLRADGTEFPIEVAFAPLILPTGKLLVSYVRDITDRVVALGLLHYQAELTRNIATHAADAMFLMDAAGYITYANPAAERTFGWTIEEMAGARLRDLCCCACDRGSPCPQVDLIPLTANGVAAEPHYDGVMCHKNGERLEVVCTHSPIVKDGVLAGGVLVVRNVTAERRSARELLAVSRRLEAHLSNSPLAAVEFAPDRTITRWSPEAERLFGFAASEVVGKNLAACPWLQPETSGAGSPVARSREGASQSSTTSFTKDGRTVHVEWYESQLRDPSGQLLSVLWLGLDVTARTLAENALRESEERFRLTLEQAPVGIAHLGLNGHYLLVNERLCQVTGYTREELVGRTFLEITHPDDVPGDEANLRALVAGNAPRYSSEKRYLRKDGSSVWVSSTASLVRHPSGEPRYLIAVVVDISDRKQAEAALHQSHDRYRFLADSMPQMVFTAAPDGAVDYHNRRWLDYTGQPLEAAPGLAWRAMVHPADREAAAAAWDASIKTGAPYVSEMRIRDVHNQHRWHLARATAMRDTSGAIVQWAGTCTDIEDQKQAEAELERKVRERTAEACEQARRAQHASQAKTEFLAMMSHEIRTPLNVIVGLGDLLWESELPPEQKEYVGVLRTAGESLLTVINDILDLAAVEARRLQIQEVAFNLDDVVDSIFSVMQPRAKTQRLDLRCDVGEGVPRQLVGDPDRLRQVLINLTGNAIKFTEKGSVTMRIRRGSETDAGTLTFSVIDTGIGIPVAKQRLIFDPFTQADSSTTRKYGGTGLGLTISRQLVELMNGRIWLESEPGVGSNFSFTIPFGIQASDGPHDCQAQDAAAAAAAAVVPGEAAEPSAPSAGPAPKRILVADDSIDNVFLIREFLKGSGYSMDVAENGMDAVTKVTKGSYDLVLMDVQMPVIDGHTATRMIRTWEFDRHRPPVPIVALTAHALRSEAEKSLRAGCTAHLTKPIQRKALLEALARYVAPRRDARILVTPPEGLADLSRDYLTRRKEGMPVLRDLVESEDYEAVRVLAHDIKGTGASYGFPPLTDTARDLEQAAISLDLERMQRALEAMENYLERTVVVAYPKHLMQRALEAMENYIGSAAREPSD